MDTRARRGSAKLRRRRPRRDERRNEGELRIARATIWLMENERSPELRTFHCR